MCRQAHEGCRTVRTAVPGAKCCHDAVGTNAGEMKFLVNMRWKHGLVKELDVLASRLGGQEEQRLASLLTPLFGLGSKSTRRPLTRGECTLKRLARWNLRS